MRPLGFGPRLAAVNRTQALRRLSKPYATALRLHEQGRDDDIATRLGIEPEAVGPLLRVAEAKLARLLEPSDARQRATDPRADATGGEADMSTITHRDARPAGGVGGALFLTELAFVALAVLGPSPVAAAGPSAQEETAEEVSGLHDWIRGTTGDRCFAQDQVSSSTC
jgi:hypothetical protein